MAQTPINATEQADTVVGLYGDPTVSWSIVLQAELRETLDADLATRRLRATAARYPHLGSAPVVTAVPSSELTATRDRFAAEPYEYAEPLVRVAVTTDEPGVLIAAHHGALDGLGLLAILGGALDVPVTSAATGIGARTASRSFLSSAAARVTEALLAPPARIAPATSAAPGAGDWFDSLTQPRIRLGTALLTAAAANAAREWNRRRNTPSSRLVAAVGASYRGGDHIEPEHRSAFFRLRLGDVSTSDGVGAMLAGQPPEPDFPARNSALARLGTRILARRLGSTFLVSNLGAISAGDAVRSLAFFPAASGRSGVTFGAATVDATTTVTVRARRRDFDRNATAALLDELARAIAVGERGSRGTEDLPHQ